jgi:plastocyanin
MSFRFTVCQRSRLVRRVVIVTVMAMKWFLVPACAEEARAVPTPKEIVVTIDNFSFNPPEVTITPGTTVTWENRDDIPHTVVETGKSFRSHALDTGDRFSFTFAGAGDFAYFCSLHPHMTGIVKVQPPPGGAAAASMGGGHAVP